MGHKKHSVSKSLRKSYFSIVSTYIFVLFDNVVSDVSLEAFSQLLDGAFLSLLRGRLFLTSKSIGERAVFFVGFLLIVLLLHVEYSATIPFLLLGMQALSGGGQCFCGRRHCFGGMERKRSSSSWTLCFDGRNRKQRCMTTLAKDRMT